MEYYDIATEQIGFCKQGLTANPNVTIFSDVKEDKVTAWTLGALSVMGLLYDWAAPPDCK